VIDRIQLPDRLFITPRAVAALILLILVQLVAAQSLNMFPRFTMIDFFQYWGVPNARRLSREPLGTPYTEYPQYLALLTEVAERSGQSRLRPPGFTATPFAYTLFATFPEEYGHAALLFHVLHVLVFFAAVILVGHVYRLPLFPVLCLALLLLIASGPLSSDMRLGNIGAFQLFGLAVLLALLERVRRAPRPVIPASVALAGLIVLALIKPNVALVVGALILFLWVALRSRLLALAAILAAPAGAAAVITSCLYFRSWVVWQEWYTAVFGRNPYVLGARRPLAGNYSTSRILSLALQTDVWIVAAIIAAALAVSMIAVIAVSPKTTDARAFRTAAAGLLTRPFGDPHLALAIGVTATISLPPLVWYHYFVIMLIPGLWLLSVSQESRSVTVALCGLAVLVLSSGLLNVLLLPLGWTTAAGVGAALSWLPLWGAILLRVYGAGSPKSAGASLPPTDERLRESPARRDAGLPRSRTSRR
jgi:hypothetical protein